MELGEFIVTVLWNPATICGRETALSEIISWLGSLAIITGFFWVQVQIDRLNKGWAHTTLFLLSLVGEVYLIWLWNSRNT